MEQVLIGEKGINAVRLASVHGHSEIFKILVGSGADVTANSYYIVCLSTFDNDSEQKKMNNKIFAILLFYQTNNVAK